MARNAYTSCKSLILNDTEVFVDFECGRTLARWKPRKLGTLLIKLVGMCTIKRVSGGTRFTSLMAQCIMYYFPKRAPN